jgi:hypothetical protein
MRFWLMAPSGEIAASGAVAADQSTLIRAPAQQTGLYVLITEGGLGSLVVSTSSRALMTTGQPLRFENPNERLYFHVPAGSDEIQMTSSGMDYKLQMKVLDANGDLRFQRDDFNYHHQMHKIPIPAGQDDKLWTLCFTTSTPAKSRAGRRTLVDLAPPLNGFVSPCPSRLVAFE